MFCKKNIYTELDDCVKLSIENKYGWFDTYIDKDSYKSVSSRSWRVCLKKHKVYIISGSFRKGNAVYLHQFLIGRAEVGKEIDHIDGDSLNNRISNLRIVTRIENIQNSKVRDDNTTSGIRGVSLSRSENTWRCDFNFNKIRFGTISCKCMEDAVYMRYCFEKHFNLHICEFNPKAKNIIDSYVDSDNIFDFVEKRISEKLLNTEKSAV